MPRPDVSDVTLDQLAGHLLSLAPHVDCMQLNLVKAGRTVRLFVAVGASADVLAETLERLRPPVGRADFDDVPE